MTKILSAISLLFAITLISGCSGSMNTSVSAAGPKTIVVPAEGGTITLNPGVYACPDSIPTSAHIIGRGALAGNEFYRPPDGQVLETDKAANQLIGPIATVRILCTHDILIKNEADVWLKNVIFDFQGTPHSVIADSSSMLDWSIGVQNNGDAPALIVRSQGDGNCGQNEFDLLAYNTGSGPVLDGGGGGAVTWNHFRRVTIVYPRDFGVSIGQFTDTNVFDFTIIAHLPDNAPGVIFNSDESQTDSDSAGNVFQDLMVDARDPSNYRSYGVWFKGGTTIGNKVNLMFSLVPESQKVHFDPGFHTDVVTRLPEHPKSGPPNF